MNDAESLASHLLTYSRITPQIINTMVECGLFTKHDVISHMDRSSYMQHHVLMIILNTMIELGVNDENMWIKLLRVTYASKNTANKKNIHEFLDMFPFEKNIQLDIEIILQLPIEKFHQYCPNTSFIDLLNTDLPYYSFNPDVLKYLFEELFANPPTHMSMALGEKILSYNLHTTSDFPFDKYIQLCSDIYSPEDFLELCIKNYLSIIEGELVNKVHVENIICEIIMCNLTSDIADYMYLKLNCGEMDTNIMSYVSDRMIKYGSYIYDYLYHVSINDRSTRSIKRLFSYSRAELDPYDDYFPRNNHTFADIFGHTTLIPDMSFKQIIQCVQSILDHMESDHTVNKFIEMRNNMLDLSS